ncbi:aspartate/glutamate racemase family protein [Bosea sp. RAF48]|uniref:aspartate/glutamate racemase family protein n=1 Tax=Bosea sp. RAF48 TaxID=3237480 RepID=UPI003F8F9BA1
MSDRIRIALVHATPVAVDPIAQSFRHIWPEADTIGVLDDGLALDRAAAGELTEALSRRIAALARYGLSTGASAILFTCSAFGPAIEEAARILPVPVLKPNAAMFEEALGYGENIGMVATFGPAVAMMEQEFAEEAKRLRPSARLTLYLASGAIEALRAGDAETHNQRVSEGVAELGERDAILLAHFSTSRAGAACRALTSRPVLSSPDAAVRKLRRLLGG